MKNQKSLTNKGFSLVELIIVVAIMAILIGVLAPQYLRYVEKSRLQKDNTSIGEVANVIKMSSGDEKVAEDIASATGAITIQFSTSGATPTNVPASLQAEIDATIDGLTNMKLSSNTYGTSGPLLHVEVDPTTKIMKVYATGWVASPATGNAAPVTSNKVF